MLYYVFSTKQKSDKFLKFINEAEFFPVTGKRKGKPSPSTQQTIRWADKSVELVSGEWGFAKIPDYRMDEIGVPASFRANAMANHQPEVRDITIDDLKVIDEEI